MPHSTSAEALEVLDRLVAGPTDLQRSVGAAVGLEMPDDLPALVAAVRLREELAEPLLLAPSRLVSEATLVHLTGLCAKLALPVPSPLSQGEADAWVRSVYMFGRATALRSLDVDSGDVVRFHGDSSSPVREVSSIGNDGTVHLRGRGRAWPDLLEVVARRHDNSELASDLRLKAKNFAALLSTPSWSTAKSVELEPWKVTEGPATWEVDEFQSMVDEAIDERPVQKYLQEHPSLLGTLLSGHERWVIPQVQLGAIYAADFCLASIDSLGISWILVELESPGSPIALQKGRHFEKRARTGIAQVEEWREWIQNNIAHARNPRAEGGVGLFDIRPDADGLVLVGRRHLEAAGSPRLRNRRWEADRIRIHTYDWLLSHLRGPGQAWLDIGLPRLENFDLDD